MNEYKAEKIRNIALVGHSSSGKTSLADALLFDTGAVNRLGKVDDATSISDFDPEEQRRKISINTSPSTSIARTVRGVPSRRA